VGLVSCVVSGWVWAQRGGGSPRKKAPTTFDRRIEDAFFKDVAKQHGEGSYTELLSSSGGVRGKVDAKPPPGKERTVNSVSGWAMLISSDTLESEIKSAINAVGPHVESKAKWNTGHRKVRTIYSTLAMCFGVISQYDGDVKYKNDAQPLRDVLARSAANSKVNDERAMIEAKKWLGELTKLRNGGRAAAEAGEAGKPFGVSEVSEVMKRMQIAYEPEGDSERGLKRWTADAARFKASKSDVVHEAELMAMMARILQDPNSFDQAADENFAKFAKEIEAASVEIVAAAKADNADAARAAEGKITKACAACHGAFR